MRVASSCPRWIAVAAVAALLPLSCAKRQVANLCRPGLPDPGASAPPAGDPFATPQSIPRDEGGPKPRGSTGPVGPEVFACVHAPSEPRGLYALGGAHPCLAALGDVRQGPEPDGPADACPAWLHANEVALFSLGRTLAQRDAGAADACCYVFRRYVYE